MEMCGCAIVLFGVTNSDKANSAWNLSLSFFACSLMCSFLRVHLFAVVIYAILYCIIHLMHSWSPNVNFFTLASS